MNGPPNGKEGERFAARVSDKGIIGPLHGDWHFSPGPFTQPPETNARPFLTISNQIGSDREATVSCPCVCRDIATA